MPLETRSIRRQSVDVRRLDLLVTETTDMIRAQRINRDQHHIHIRLRTYTRLVSRLRGRRAGLRRTRMWRQGSAPSKRGEDPLPPLDGNASNEGEDPGCEGACENRGNAPTAITRTIRSAPRRPTIHGDAKNAPIKQDLGMNKPSLSHTAYRSATSISPRRHRVREEVRVSWCLYSEP